MIEFSPAVTEAFPAIVGLVVAGIGWVLIFYTRFTRARRRNR